EHGIRVCRLRRRSYRALGVNKRLRSVPGSYQQCGVISKDRRIFRLEAKRTVEIAPRLVNIAVFELEFPRDEVRSRAERGIAFTFKFRKSVGVDLAIFNNVFREVAFVCQAFSRNEDR